jgi:hypothetical protein
MADLLGFRTHHLSTLDINATHSTCLEEIKSMPLESGIPLAAGYISGNIAFYKLFHRIFIQQKGFSQPEAIDPNR